MDTSMASTQAEHIMNRSDDELLDMIGQQMRMAEIIQSEDPALLDAAKLTGELTVVPEHNLGEDLRAFGQRWWNKIEPEVYNLVCRSDSKDRKAILDTLPQPSVASEAESAAEHERASARTATVLAPLLVGLIPFEIPLVASAAATIAARTLLSTGVSSACDIWAAHMQQEAE